LKAAFVLVALAALSLAGWLAGFGGAASRLLIENAVAQPMDDGHLGAFLSIDNQGAPDRLLSVSSPVAAATLYSPASAEGLPVPSGHSALALDAAHISIRQPETPFAHGALVPLVLSFANAGDVTVKARMSDPAQAGAAGEVGLFGMGDICIVGDGEPAPEITIGATPEGDGWQVRITASDFTFSEDLMGLYHVPGTGHGHIYVGGMKLGRLFAPEYHIGPLPPGSHEIRVTLNTNDHRAYVVGDTPVTASTIITVD
jgi:copper(I)-binding protein